MRFLHFIAYINFDRTPSLLHFAITADVLCLPLVVLLVIAVYIIIFVLRAQSLALYQLDRVIII